MTKYTMLALIIIITLIFIIFALFLRGKDLDSEKAVDSVSTPIIAKPCENRVLLGKQFSFAQGGCVGILSPVGESLFTIRETENQDLKKYIQNIYDFRAAEEKRSGKKSLNITYVGYDADSITGSESENLSLGDVFSKTTVILQSSGTGDLPIMTVFYIDGRAYALYSAPEGPNGEKLESSNLIITDYTKQMSERLGVSVAPILNTVIERMVNRYKMTSQIYPPRYYIQKMYRSSKDNKIKVAVKTYLEKAMSYELSIDAGTNKIVGVAGLE